jgi:hypothetical protein
MGENMWIRSSNKDKLVTQYQAIAKKNILEWVIQIVEGINRQLE